MWDVNVATGLSVAPVGDFLAGLKRTVGAAHVIRGVDDEAAPYRRDWTGQFSGSPIAVVKPKTTQEVAEVVKLCCDHGVSMVPTGGRTGLCGGGVPIGDGTSVLISLERMNSVRHLDQDGRSITVEAGVVLQTAQERARDRGLVFPLTFGAQGSAMIGGVLSTNAGGSNVVRYGTARELCIGIEAVLPNGSVINALTGLRKDNTGYDLRDLLIGAEGTLGIITAAVFKLFPEPKARTTGFLSLAALADAPRVLNVLQDRSGGGVEAFEYMPKAAVDVICRVFPKVRKPLEDAAQTGVFFEVTSPREDDAQSADGGGTRLESLVFSALEVLMEEGIVVDAMIAQSEQQRLDLWAMREAILEAITENGPAYHMDISLPLAAVAEFVATMDEAVSEMGFQPLTVGHLGDGNLHYALSAQPGRNWADLPLARAKQAAFALLAKLNGSFSAEHGIGQSKLDVMIDLKESSQLDAMRAIKTALDPSGLINPGKLIPVPRDP
ncbi:FAD-binding oxidoreductase [Poseidonocella sedimentorum]|uniref:FAD/FMN-containing dehydrogenase n=1 Tax=Poseidonocella sedimentorum TaxID=871652 RepID=A0A1I6E6G3_9RHOB|nr:FAD-binding oxidoreductase [Poseidonocella sedimentorum]SFR13323.1 FAD/FMN-containing dehydrogenase [Poseidonocella sedimentorum]